jgi:diguanylate cyclase (GGDEF)-like protein
MSDVSKVDREQRFSALLMQDADHELHDLARAIHGALLSAHRDRLEAAHLRRELDARVQRQTKAVVAQWQKLSNTDELTGLCNRRGFDLAFADLFRAAADDGEELALLAVDMDYFKQLNDACGHATGDAALKAAGEVLRSQLRNGDVAGRVGGDEFLVALRGTGPRDAMIVAQRLMDLYSKTPAAVGLPVRWPTFSIGIACAGEQRALEAGHLREMADQALYAVKRSGRAGARVWKPQDNPGGAPAATAGPAGSPAKADGGAGAANSSSRAA